MIQASYRGELGQTEDPSVEESFDPSTEALDYGEITAQDARLALYAIGYDVRLNQPWENDLFEALKQYAKESHVEQVVRIMPGGELLEIHPPSIPDRLTEIVIMHRNGLTLFDLASRIEYAFRRAPAINEHLQALDDAHELADSELAEYYAWRDVIARAQSRLAVLLEPDRDLFLDVAGALGIGPGDLRALLTRPLPVIDVARPAELAQAKGPEIWLIVAGIIAAAGAVILSMDDFRVAVEAEERTKRQEQILALARDHVLTPEQAQSLIRGEQQTHENGNESFEQKAKFWLGVGGAVAGAIGVGYLIRTFSPSKPVTEGGAS